MKVALAPVDFVIIGVYMVAMAGMGFWLKKRATGKLDAFFLGGRGIPWWMLGLSGCSSYIDIGGTMGMVGVLYYLGLKGIWATNIVWGWLIICFYMAFQAKYIRRSGVMTFAEWNETRFGPGGGTEGARFVAAAFLLVLMVFNLTFISVGIGKFAEEFLPLARWQSTLIVFATVGVYVTAGGFFGVIYTDIVQTVLIFAGAGALAWMASAQGDTRAFLEARPAEWASIAPTWNLWDGFLSSVPEALRGSYRHFDAFGPILLASSTWLIFRVLAGPNVWDFQFFLSARSTRDAAIAGGVWTVGHTARWVLAVSFLVLSLPYLGPGGVADGEKIMPLVLKQFPIGVRGLFMAILLAALMSTLSAMINVTSSVAVNDILKRYVARRLSERGLVIAGQFASIAALVIAFAFSLPFNNVIDIWELMLYLVVTWILVPATLRWHWWRIGAKGFTWGVVGSALFLLLHFALFRGWSKHAYLATWTLGSMAISLAAALLAPPASMDVLVGFYARVRPFGFWGPVRREAVRRGLVPAGDAMPALDVLNGLLASVLQIALCAVPFCALVGLSREAWGWTAIAALTSIVLLFTWYRTLPARDEGEPAVQPPAEARAPSPAEAAGG